MLHYSEQRGQELIEQGRNSSRGPVHQGSRVSPLMAAMGSDSFYSCWVFWQDDVKLTSKGLPSYKPPPPPSPLTQGHEHLLIQPRKPGREDLQPPSAASSHSGIVFSAPRNCSPPAGTAPVPEAPTAQDSPSSPSMPPSPQPTRAPRGHRTPTWPWSTSTPSAPSRGSSHPRTLKAPPQRPRWPGVAFPRPPPPAAQTKRARTSILSWWRCTARTASQM